MCPQWPDRDCVAGKGRAKRQELKEISSLSLMRESRRIVAMKFPSRLALFCSYLEGTGEVLKGKMAIRDILRGWYCVTAG